MAIAEHSYLYRDAKRMIDEVFHKRLDLRITVACWADQWNFRNSLHIDGLINRWRKEGHASH